MKYLVLLILLNSCAYTSEKLREEAMEYCGRRHISISDYVNCEDWYISTMCLEKDLKLDICFI